MLPVKVLLDTIVENYHNILKDNLIGIYLHGSLAMNCFNASISDIDFLVVIKDNISSKTKRQLIEVLLDISKTGPNKGFEMSVVLDKNLRPFIYPTPFVLHFSKMHEKRYKEDTNYLCESWVDEDLAAHITITIHRGISIYGKPIKDVFGTVPEINYVDSILSDIKDSTVLVYDSPIYYVLNLCRVLCYLKEKTICSKKEGGDWAICNIPSQYKDVVNKALTGYKKGTSVKLENDILKEFVEFMMFEIDKGIENLKINQQI